MRMLRSSRWLVLLVAAGCSSSGGGGGAGGRGAGMGGEGGGAPERDAGGGKAGTGGSGGARADAGGDAMAPRADAPGPDTTTGGGADAGPDACDPFAVQVCQRLMACSPLYLSGIYGDLAVCQDRVRTECRSESALTGSGFDRAAIETCQGAMASASCDDLFGGRVAACQRKGTLANEAPCGSNAQCQSGFCRMPETAFCGKCAARAAEGAPCDVEGSCQFPLMCSEAGRCVTPAGEGDLCNESRPCRPGGSLFCASDNSCKRRSAEGKACNSTATAPRQPCEIGHTCRPSANGLCRAIRFAAPGAACGLPSSSSGTLVLCRGSGSCVRDVCRPPGQDGEACTISPLGDSGGCLPPALCLEGRCKLPDPASCM